MYDTHTWNKSYSFECLTTSTCLRAITGNGHEPVTSITTFITLHAHSQIEYIQARVHSRTLVVAVAKVARN